MKRAELIPIPSYDEDAINVDWALIVDERSCGIRPLNDDQFDLLLAWVNFYNWEHQA